MKEYTSSGFSVMASGLCRRDPGSSGCFFLNAARALLKLSKIAWEEWGLGLIFICSESKILTSSQTNTPFFRESV